MAPPPGPYSGTSTLALVARVSAFSAGLVYGSIKLKYLKGLDMDLDGLRCQILVNSVNALNLCVEREMEFDASKSLKRVEPSSYF
ncbi:hypothetical protein CK203_022335 [Vitis vinifera]|uniref:Uncharacterized protein n=1 Tax=Vitis vinifera TaxID=29760 RepID=A0A438I9E1_VITVI|nr:hypothetical protein CK203_072808 [Vitis vinifera]RVW93345.1 hypothetical protein CK203_022335 [Vitis vinifera]